MIVRVLFYLYKLRRDMWLKPSTLEEMRDRRLRAIIKYAYENVPFYHRKFDHAGIKPDDIKTVRDMPKVPVTTKLEIQQSPLDETIARNHSASNLIKRRTSGSTGMPLTIILDQRTEDFHSALRARAHIEDGLKLGDKIVIIKDPHRFETLHEQSYFGLRRKCVSIFEDVQKTISILENIKPDVIEGYPSSLSILANAYRRKERRIQPRLVFTIAEILDKETRKLITSVLETEVFDLYGTAEFGPLAWECGEHIGYHINVDSVAMEFIKDGEVVAPGERGEIICTGLINYAMPLIRYDIGDVGIPSDEQCPCRRALPLLRMIEGRADDFLVTPDNRIISPRVFFPYPFEEDLEIKQFRVIQERRDKLTIQLAVEESFSGDVQVWERAKEKINRLFGEDMLVEFQVVDEIPKDSSGKLRKVMSRISLST